MGLTSSERAEFVAALKGRGWSMDGEVIKSSSNGLWFGESHFNDWTLKEFREIFTQRAKRIQSAQLGDWKEAAEENKDVADVAELLLAKISKPLDETDK